MLWLELTSERIGDAIEESGGLCLLPMGCIERHGPHLPLGTDQIVADEVARRAAEQEPAVVFPSYYFGQIAEARHHPGTVSLEHELLLKLLKVTLEEIGRNGFTKVLIVNGHGGSIGLLNYLNMAMLQERHSYVLYGHFLGQMEEEDRKQWEAMKETSEGGHAGESETSTMMHVRPDLVRMDDIRGPEDGRARRWQEALGGVQNPFWWYANYPTALAGDPRPATPQKGEFLIGACVRKLVKVMQAVKADDVTPRLQEEFHDKADAPLA